MVMDRFREITVNGEDEGRPITKEEKLKRIVDQINSDEQHIRDNKKRLKEEFGFEHIADANKKLVELSELRTALNQWS